MATRRTSDELLSDYDRQADRVRSKLEALKSMKSDERKAAAETALKDRLALIARRKTLAQGRSRQDPRKADTQAKIVIGAISQHHLETNPKNAWLRADLYNGLKNNPKTIRNQVLRDFFRSLVVTKETPPAEVPTEHISEAEAARILKTVIAEAREKGDSNLAERLTAVYELLTPHST